MTTLRRHRRPVVALALARIPLVFAGDLLARPLLNAPGMATTNLWGLLCVVSVTACGGAGISSSPDPLESTLSSAQWACIGEATNDSAMSTVQEQGAPPVAFDVSLVEATTHAPVGGLDLTLCLRSDEDCTVPLSQATADAMGVATLQAPGPPSTLDGFVRVSGPGLATHYVFLPHRVPAYGSTMLVFELYTPAALQTVLGGAPAIDALHALVRVDTHDCADASAAGVVVSVGGSGLQDALIAYPAGDSRVVSPRLAQTDGTGAALGLGVRDGLVGVADVVDGQLAGGAVAFARAGAVSSLVVRP